MSRYGNISSRTLKAVVAEVWDENLNAKNVTLKEELDRLLLNDKPKQKILHAEYKFDRKQKKLSHFRAWTQSTIIVYMSSPFGWEHFLLIPRKPPTK